MENKPFTACKVCGGAGGWKGPKSWMDCPNCEGYGFHKLEEPEVETNTFWEYLSYRTRIMEKLSDGIGEVTRYHTDDYGKTIEITLAPRNRTVWSSFVNSLLKIAHFSSSLSVRVIQEFHHDRKRNGLTYTWKLVLATESPSDLDGFCDLLNNWEGNHVF